jgi:hypothetical protein
MRQLHHVGAFVGELARNLCLCADGISSCRTAPDREIRLVVPDVVETAFAEGFNQDPGLDLSRAVGHRIRGEPTREKVEMIRDRLDQSLVASRCEVDSSSFLQGQADDFQDFRIIGERCGIKITRLREPMFEAQFSLCQSANHADDRVRPVAQFGKGALDQEI